MELFANQNRRSYSLYFDLKIWFRARNLAGAFEKRAPGAEMRPASVSGITTVDTPTSYWPIP